MSPQMGPPETTMQEFSGPDTSWEREFEAFEAALEGKAADLASMEDALAVLKIVHSSYFRSTE
jgi:predicted dehydrogenase